MKQGSALAAALALLLGTVGLLSVTKAALSPARGQTVSQWLARTQLGDMAKAPAETTLVRLNPTDAQETSEQVESLESEPQPVPVTEVQEAWDEEARKTEAIPPAPSPVTVDGDLSLEIRNETDYPVVFSELPALPEGMKFDTTEPVILLMHTHGSESYEDPANPGVYRTSDPSKSVLAVAEAMKTVLEQRGYGTIHDDTICDEPEFTGAYNRSRQVIQENLAAYPSLQLVLDVHRDAVEDENGDQIRMVCQLEGDTVAQLMLVVGSDAGGLEHPDWRENLSLAAVLQARLAGSCPGLMRPVNLRTERFNQDLAPMDLLVEVGSSGDTLEEAIRAARVFAEALADVLDQYSGKSS